MTSASSSRIKRKQWLILSGALAAITIATLLATRSAEQKAVQAIGPAPAQTRDISLGVGGATEEAARAALARQMEAMSQRLREIEEQNAAQARERAAALDAAKKAPPASGVPPPAPPTVPPPTELPPAPSKKAPFSLTGLGMPPPDAPFKGDEKGVGRPGVPGRNIKTTELSDPPPAPPGAGPGRVDPPPPPPQPSGGRYIDDDPLTPNRAAGRTAETFITPGTFCRAVMLIGIEAPTGGQAQGNPVPGQLEILEDCQMPNGRRAPLKGCFVTVNGYAELSSERAYLRTDRLSCIDNESAAVDIAVRGYVVGEDGQTGLRGPLVSKQGQAIANSINAALASGIGRAIVAASAGTVVVPYGTTQSPGSEFKAGAGQGISRGFDQISDYYLKLADKMYPTVSIASMRVVNISFSRGFQFEQRIPSKE